jgi:hypothetical protein
MGDRIVVKEGVEIVIGKNEFGGIFYRGDKLDDDTYAHFIFVPHKNGRWKFYIKHEVWPEINPEIIRRALASGEEFKGLNIELDSVLFKVWAREWEAADKRYKKIKRLIKGLDEEDEQWLKAALAISADTTKKS